MNKTILTQNPSGEWVYLTEEFLKDLPNHYFNGEGLGFLPALAPLVAGSGGAAAAGTGIASAAKAAVAVIPNLLKNDFWKDAGPAVDELSSAAQSQLAQSKAVNEYTKQLIAASNQQNAAFSTINSQVVEETSPNRNFTPYYIGGGVLLAAGILMLVRNKKNKSSKKSK